MSHCPWCHTAHNYHQSGLHSQPPVTGDVSICWTCRQIGIYTDDGIRMPNREEYEEVMSDPEVRKVIFLTVDSPTPASAIQRWRES